MAKTIYLNLEDDVTKVVNKLKREKTADVVLVFPKKSFIFSDSINLRLLKKQLDLLGKKVSILTMDDRGKMYAEEAGFEIKRMPRSVRASSFSDIRQRTAPAPKTIVAAEPAAVPPKRKLETKKATTRARAAASVAASSGATSRSAARSAVAWPRAQRVASISTISELAPVISKDNVFLPPNAKSLRPPRKRSYRSYVIGFIALILIVILLLVLVVLPSASITVFAKSQSVARDLDILVDTKAQSAQSSNLTVPAVAVNEAKSSADSFNVNGKKELGSKAEGRVAIYNLTGQAMALRANTTTLTIGTKTYIFKADQGNVRAVSGANDSNATLADIVAVEGGEGSNVPAGTRVEITNQAFGSQPNRLYAKTVTQVVGGNSRFVSVITKEDLETAQRELTKRAVESINSSLAGNNVKLVEGAYSVNVESFTADKSEGTEAQSFSAELKASFTGLAFDELALKNMVRQRLLVTLGTGKSLQDVNQDSVIYRIKNLDTQNGIMQLSVHYESKAKPSIDATDLKNKIAGKSKQEASDLILANNDVDRVEITVQPAWQSGLPRFGSKINLEVKE